MKSRNMKQIAFPLAALLPAFALVAMGVSLNRAAGDPRTHATGKRIQVAGLRQDDPAKQGDAAKQGDQAKPGDAKPAEAAKATYIGHNACDVCHTDIHKSWSKKAHPGAFALLVARKQDKNPECLKCHTTGYGKGGFVDAEKTPDLKGVTCEACHGPGSEHNGDKEKIVRVPPATVCTDCHMKSNIH